MGRRLIQGDLAATKIAQLQVLLTLKKKKKQNNGVRSNRAAQNTFYRQLLRSVSYRLGGSGVRCHKLSHLQFGHPLPSMAAMILDKVCGGR